MIRFLQTPGPVKKIVLSAILLLISLTMVITLVPGDPFSDYFGMNTEGVVARVAGERITREEVRQAAQDMGRQQMGGRSVPAQFMPFLMQQAANNLILRKLVLDEADRLGLTASKEELIAELKRYPDLFKEGKYIGDEALSDLLQQNGLTIDKFQRQVTETLTIRKLQAAITGGVTVSDAEILEAARKQNTKVKFDYAVLTIQDVEKQIKPSEQELRAFYEQQKEVLKDSIPEQRKARYIVLDPSKINIQVTQDDLRRHYNQRQEEYRTSEEVEVRHILVKTPSAADGKPDQKAIDQAKAKAEGILKQLNGGADFAALAKKSSDDPGSAENGGSLGWIQRGRTVPEFEQAAFGATKGQLVGPVQSSFGFHIIRVDDKRQARLRSLDEVRAEIEPIVRREKAQGELDRLARTLEAHSRTAGMEKAAADRGLQITNSEFFSRTDSLPGIGNSQDFMNAVFDQKPNSPPQAVHTDQGYAIVQTTDMKPASTPTFEQARAQLENQFRAQRAQQLLTQKTQQLSDRARAEHSLRKAAKEVGATVKTSDFVTAQQQVPEVGSMSDAASVAFSMKPGEISGPLRPQTGSGIVIALLDSQEPSKEELEKAKGEVRDQLLQQKRNVTMELFVNNLKKKMYDEGKVKENADEMKRLASAAQQGE
jgi:peptidyl-prolyl cis-trans isomerase D